jgi:exopolysaccharide production protein ExoZ
MNKLPALQILRGIAASLVVLDHSVLRHAEWNDYPSAVTVAAQYSGTLGVAVFFVISGYIMIHTAGSQFGHPGAATAFLRKRIIRIVPLYWAATMLEVALRLRKGGSLDPQQLLSSLFFIPQSVEPGNYMRPLLGVGWTLNYEMFFYCIFAIALFFKKPAGLVLLFSTLLGLVALGAMSKSLTDTSQPYTVLGFWTDPIILLFAAGVAVGLIPKAARRQATSIHPVVAAVGLLLAYATVFLFAVGSYPIPLAWQAGGWALCILAAGLCVLGKQNGTSAAEKIGTQLGDTSYALYLFHFFAIVAAEKIWWLLFGKNPSILFILAAYLTSVVAAYAIHHLIEVNVARLLAARSTRAAPGFRQTDTVSSDAIPRQHAPAPHRSAHL